MNEKVLVTGGGGFLGKYVVNKLLYERYNVKIVRSYKYNLIDKNQTEKLFEEYQPDFVIHLAAKVGGIGANMNNPGSFFYDNMMMGLNVIHQSYLHGIKKVILIGTVCSYPKFCEVPFKEEDLWNGYPEETNAAYGIAKKSLMVMLEAYNKQYNLNGISLLPCNLYGPGDNFDPSSSHVIPALIKKFFDAKRSGIDKVVCWGTGDATREFLYVEDAAEAIVKSVNIDTNVFAVNLAGGKEIKIRHLVEKIKNLVGFQGDVIWDVTKPDGQPRRFLDNRRAEEILGWKSKMDFSEGLKNTIEYYNNVIYKKS